MTGEEKEHLLDTIFREHDGYMRALVRRFFRGYGFALTDEIADDVVFDVYRRLISHGLDRFQGSCKITTYLFPIVRNCCLNAMERIMSAGRSGAVHDDSDVGDIPVTDISAIVGGTAAEPIGDPSDFVERDACEDMMRTVRKAVDELTREDRLVFRMVFEDRFLGTGEGDPARKKEVARMLGISPASLTGRLEVITRAIRTALERNHPDEVRLLRDGSRIFNDHYGKKKKDEEEN